LNGGFVFATGTANKVANDFRSLTQIVAERLRDGIFRGEFPPGSRLNIADLAAQFSVSAVPVREALRNLETEGLVKFRINRGAIVNELSRSQVRELYLIRFPLELLAAVEASRHADEKSRRLLEAILGRMDKTTIGSEKWHELHQRFHDELNLLAQLPHLSKMIRVLRGQMRPYSKTYLENREHLAAAQVEHYQLVQAVCDRNQAAIRRIIREHLHRPARLAMRAFGASETVEIE
jgi:DNA-binding GntR family transcriptional regulator